MNETDMPPSYIQTDTERTLWLSRERDREVIAAMQRRIARNPIRDVLWSKPWKASYRPRGLRGVWSWLRAAHDCADPAVGCSCYGGFRFPAT